MFQNLAKFKRARFGDSNSSAIPWLNNIIACPSAMNILTFKWYILLKFVTG